MRGRTVSLSQSAPMHAPSAAVVTSKSLRTAEWHRAARWARLLAWVSLFWMLIEGAVGLWQGLLVGSIALTGWALGSAVKVWPA